MSFRKKGRKFRTVSGKLFPKSSDKFAASDGYNYADVIAETLRETFGGTRVSVKTVMAYTGASERTVKNWFEGKNGPNGENLVELARHSDEVLEVFLLMAGREEILTGKLLVDARDKLAEMLDAIVQLQAGDSAADPPNG
jgi:hypothetical protein